MSRAAPLVTLIFTAAAILGLSACGSSADRYQPIVDGDTGAGYHQDLQACQALSRQRGYLNDAVKSQMLLGGALGSVVGAVEEGSRGALAGAVVGGAIHGIGRAWKVREERERIIIDCMKQRGHDVVG